MKLEARFRGAMLGLAAGDAVGAALEFRAPGTFAKIDDMIGGGPFGLAVGEWTDDTSMALCLAESLIEKQGFDHDSRRNARRIAGSAVLRDLFFLEARNDRLRVQQLLVL